MQCKNCNSKNILKKKFNFDFYSHKNFSKISSNNTYLECRNCKIIYSIRILFLKKLYNKIFSKKKIYRNQEILTPKFNGINLYQHFFNNEIKRKTNVSILDYGNSSKSQLRNYSNFFYNSKIFFYDITVSKDYLFYNKKTNTKCILTNELKKIDQNIDIIMSFNSLQYYLEYKKFFKFVKFVSYFKTKMFVITPSIEVNKYFLLLGDEFFKFSKTGLINFLQFNLSKNTKILKRDYLSTYNFALVNFNNDKIFKKNERKLNLYSILKFLNQKSNKVKNLNFKRVYIFGTRINSCFISKYLKNFAGLIDDQSNNFIKNYKLLDKIKDKKIKILIPYSGIKYKMIKNILVKKKFKNIFKI